VFGPDARPIVDEMSLERGSMQIVQGDILTG
jgi:hypothetical protein